MPFNSSGVYTPPAGATTAAPGDVIRSATWNSIFSDISSALTMLGQQLYKVTLVTATPYTVLSTDTFVQVNFAGAVTINLPTAASRNGYPVKIKDISGAAHTNVITILPNGAETIEGSTSLLIQNDWQGYTLYPTSGGWVLEP